jgi:hypothetical protein
VAAGATIARALHRSTAKGPSRDKYRGDVAGRAVRAPYRTLLCHSAHVLSGSNRARTKARTTAVKRARNCGLAWKRYSSRTALRDVAPALNGRASLARVRPSRGRFCSRACRVPGRWRLVRAPASFSSWATVGGRSCTRGCTYPIGASSRCWVTGPGCCASATVHVAELAGLRRRLNRRELRAAR